MRLFFALWPPEPVRNALHEWALACQAQSRGRLTRRENLHATLVFLGSVERARLAAVTEAARSIVSGPFDLVLDRIGYWQHNRIVYAGASVMPARLTQLARALSTRLAACGFPTEERPYVAHVTLLRDARGAPVGTRPAAVTWPVDAISLIESVADPQGVRYEPLERWTLSG